MLDLGSDRSLVLAASAAAVILGSLVTAGVTKKLYSVLDCDLLSFCRERYCPPTPRAYDGQVVLITGASSGIGRAVARKFAQYGATLILCSRKEAELKKVKDSIQQEAKEENRHCEVCVMVVDVSDIENVEQAASQAIKLYGRVDILVNCAGVSSRIRGLDLNFETFQKVTNTNYIGLVGFSVPILKEMARWNKGHVVNITSIAGKVPVPLRTAYGASKAAVERYFEALQLELGEPRAQEADIERLRHNKNDWCGIHVTNVSPGPIRTNISQNSLLADGELSGKADTLISQGMEPDRAADVIIAGVYNKSEEIWLSKPPFLTTMYLFEYLRPLGKWKNKRMTELMMKLSERKD